MRVVLRVAQNLHFDLMSEAEAALEDDEPMPDHTWSLNLSDLEDTQTDSMGRDMIMYWPSLEPIPEEEVGPEED